MCTYFIFLISEIKKNKIKKKKKGLIIHIMLDSIMRVKNKATANINGLMEVFIMATGSIIKYMVMALIFGLMVDSIVVNGLVII